MSRFSLIPAIGLSLLYWAIYAWSFSSVYSPFAAMRCFSAGLLIYLYVVLLHKDRLLLVLSIAGLLLLLSFPMGRFSYELEEHLQTVRDYSAGLPSLGAGGQSYQPPLYYALAGQLNRLSHGQWEVLQPFSFLLFGLFCLYSVLAIRLALRSRLFQSIAVIALFLWPANFIHASRVGNDVLLYLAFAACTYHLLCWQRNAQEKQLALTIAWLSIGLLSGYGAIVLLALYALVAIRTLARQRHQPSASWPSLLAMIFLMLTMFIVISRPYFYYLIQGKPAMAGMVEPTPSFELKDYILLDYWNYIVSPYLPAAQDGHLFWNYFLRSLLYGPFAAAGGIDHAGWLNFLLLAVGVYAIALISHRQMVRRLTLSPEGYYFVYVLLCLLGLALGKAFYLPSWADPRHLYAIVPFFLLAYCHLLEDYHSRGDRRVALTGVWLLGIFCATSAYHLFLQITA